MKVTKGRKEAPVIEDARFSRLHTDPRFQRLPKAKSKVAIDPRFSRMFNDKAFAADFVVDKRGRKAKKKSGENLQKYYRLEGTGDDVKDDSRERTKNVKVSKASKKIEKLEEGGEEGKEVEDDNTEEESEEQDESQEKEKDQEEDEEEESRIKVDRRITRDEKTRNRNKTEDSTNDEDDEGEEGEAEDDEEDIDPEVGKVGSLKLHEGEELGEEDESGKSSESESSSSSDEESDTEIEEEPEEEEKIPTMEDATPRLALVNLDWDHVRAVDIFMLMRSFLPKGGSIKSVSVYPSDFGIQQMKEEQEKGPMGFIARKGTEGEEEKGMEDGEDSEGEFDDARLRKYEKSRLKYFYAVIVCDSSATANVLYEQCDGLEFERSSNTLDLRFIPDEVSIGDDREPRDVATQVASDWVAPDFTTGVLQYSRVKLTWDDDEPKRVKVLRRKLSEDQVNEMNFQDYVASGSEYEDEDDEVVEEFEEGEEGPGLGEGEGEGEGEESVGEGDRVGEGARVEKGDGEGEGDKKEEGNLKGVEGGNGVKENRTKSNLTKEQKREQMREKYRKLLLGGGDEKTGKVGNKKGKEEDEDDGEAEGEDMEITFATGLTELSEKLKQKKVEKERQASETVFEAYLRKRAEKRRMKKNERKGNEEEGEDPDDDLYGGRGIAMDDPFFTQEENPFDDPFFASADGGEGENNGKGKGGKGEVKVEDDGKTRQKNMGKEGLGGKPSQEERIRKREEAAREKREEQKRRAELELLMMDDTREEREVKGFNLKSKKKKGKKGERGKGQGEDEEEDEGKATKVNFDDPRFANLFDSHLYAIDPTDPNFRRSSGQVSILAEKQRRRFQENRNVANENVTAGTSSSLVGEVPSSGFGNEKSVKEKREKAELSTLVRSLKRKAEARVANTNSRRVKGS